jgi:maltooligosyltrehalose trehalohydrolase
MALERTRRCGAIGLDNDAVCWRVWAPRARQVDLVLIDGQARRSFTMTPEEHGYFSHTQVGIVEGQRYAYRLDGGPERPDPASLWQPEGVHRPSAVLLPQRFAWSDDGWRGLAREELVFYEIHVGTFTPEGTFDAIIPRLESLRILGVTAIELMPVAQFPGTRNWGYDGVHLFAPQNSYGGPHGLQRLVNACHAEGLAVFLDVVYNHLGPEGNYLHEFGPYFSDRYKTYWGPAFNYDSAGCDAVRDLVLDNVRLWIQDYHLDGLRLDAVHAIYDMSPRHIFRVIKETANACAAASGRRVQVIAESDLNDVRLLLPPERGGYGLDAQWSDDFHHAVHAYLTGERQGYYVDFGNVNDFPKLLEKTFIRDGGHSKCRDRKHGAPTGDLPGDRFVVSIQNHDQIGNRAYGERLSKLLTPPAQRLAASMMLLAPHLPLLFMGEEYGEEHPFLFFCSFLDPSLNKQVRDGRRREFAAFAWQGEVPDPPAESTFAASKLTWSWPAGTHHAGMRQLYRDLLKARRSWPALKDYQQRSAHLHGNSILRLIRGGTASTPDRTLQIEFNLSDQVQPLVQRSDLQGHLLFSSEMTAYGGRREPGDAIEQLLPYECLVIGPPRWENFTLAGRTPQKLA